MKHIRRILLIAAVVLFMLLALFQAAPLTYGSSTQYAMRATMQLARSNSLGKNALILVSNAESETAKIQARSDIQVTLPLFKEQQEMLRRSRDQGIHEKLQQAQSPYLALVTSAQTLLDRPDPVQASIVVVNSRTYNAAMNQYLLSLQAVANNFNLWLCIIQEANSALIVACFIGVIVTKKVGKNGQKEET